MPQNHPLEFLKSLSFIQTPIPLMFVLTVMTGVMCFLMGLLAELLTGTYHESQDKPVYVVGDTRKVKAHSGERDRRRQWFLRHEFAKIEFAMPPPV